jgi:hypothetical protein
LNPRLDEVSLAAGAATVQYAERQASPAQLKSAVTGAVHGVDTATLRGNLSDGRRCV